MSNSKQTKSALFSSVVALLLCFTMLLGTTFAWFTDNASSSVNKIQAGTLDIQLLDASGNSLEGKTLSWQKATGHENNEVLWEPGCTYNLQNITIKNNGNLALKYKIEITGIQGDAKLNEAIDWTITNSNTVSDLGADHSLAVGASNTLTISGHMKETAGNEYQGLSIDGIAITVLATQDTVEYDSTGNQYDKNAEYDRDIWDGNSTTEPVADADGVYHITTAAELVGMMNDSKYPNNNKYQNVVLENNIDLGGRTISGFGDDSGFFDGIFDGQGYTISNFTIDATNRDYYAGLFNQVAQYSGENTVIKNLNVANATIKGTSQVGAIVGGMNGNTVVENCKVINCDLYATKKVGSVVGYTAGGIVTNNYAENCTVIYREKEGSEILGYENTGSTVKDNTYKDVEVMQANVVSSATELAALGGSNIEGTYVLMADINMANTGMQPMVVPAGATVTFVGNGHTISNLKLGAAGINGMTGAGNEVAGLFDMTAAHGNAAVSLTVKDLTISNATVECSGYAAAIVGYNSVNDTVITLENVDVNTANIKAETVAGLVGYSTGEVNLSGCDVSGLILTGEENRPEKVGAYIGTANTVDCVVTTSNCTNSTTYNDYGRVINGATYK